MQRYKEKVQVQKGSHSQTSRKIERMYELSGGTDNHKCADCCNLEAHFYDRRYYKCKLYGTSHSESTDWKKSYQACAWFNQNRSERNIVNWRTAKTENQPLDGQMTFGIEVSE